MYEGLAMLVTVVAVFLLCCVLLLAGVTYYESSKAEIPPGIANPKLLWRIHAMTIAFSNLGKTCQKLGICSEIGFLHKLMRFSKTEEDPELFMKNLQFEGVPVRVYQPRSPSVGDRKGVMFFHGGGFVFGSIDSHDKHCRYIAKTSGAVVVSVGYRLAPEHRYPAAFDDCLSATTHFLKTAHEHGVDSSSIIICGDSAGGNLTAAVCQALVSRTDLPKPLAQVLIYPAVQMVDYNLPSYQQNSMVPLLLRERTVFYKLHYLGCFCDDLCKEVLLGSHVPPEMRRKLSKWLSIDNIPKEFTAKGYKTHNMAAFKNNVYEKVKRVFEPHFSPLLAEESVIRLLPKAYILTCEFDVLRDDGLLYKRRLEDNGIPVTWYHVKDGFHGVVSFFDGPNCSSGKLALDNAKTFLKLGICSEFGFLRPLMRFSRTAEDPELYMKNLQFEGVPVRVYQPRSPSVGNRKGVMFFHGGGFIFGSIDSYDNHCRYIAKTSGAVVVSVGSLTQLLILYTLHHQARTQVQGFTGHFGTTTTTTTTTSCRMWEGLAMLVTVVAVFLLCCVLLLAVVTCYECSKAEMPPEIANPKLLWRYHAMNIAVFSLVKTFLKLGICSEFGFLRSLKRFSRTAEDPELYMKNLQFEGVPVRVYQPRSPSVGDKKGVMFFHGGGFMFGSIGKEVNDCGSPIVLYCGGCSYVS
ncbi:arylacetamide deacetylase-like 4 isoform X3 [Pseudophryne corroboree]|uniref:arylacetamide deacetylase-like 4 isoform X3 n=1 Tax=Pseudophryne corroboree TaxID=495146 RepID=UPI00308211D7